MLGALGGIGGAIPGIGQTVGGIAHGLRGLQNYQSQMEQAQRLAELRTGGMSLEPGVYPGKLEFDVRNKNLYCHCGYCPVKRNIDTDSYTVNQTSNCWLDSRIERIRLLGREWLMGKVNMQTIDARTLLANKPKIKKSPPGVSDGIPVRYLPNGDALYAYDQPLPEEVLRQWNAANARIQSKW